MSNNPETALATRDQLTQVSEFHAFSISMFEDAQRMAKCLCTSDVVPEIYRGEAKIGNCMIALEMSNRIGANVLAVMQNLYIVYGRPAWSSQFLISCVNASKRFTALRYRMTGDKANDTWGCIAWATDKEGEKLESPEVTIKMAKDEGWFQKNGSKWKTIPELMLRYRAATFFTRLYAPEITMGILTREEAVDAVDVESEVVAASHSLPAFAPKLVTEPASEPEKPKEVVLGAPTPAAKRRGRPPTAPPPHNTGPEILAREQAEAAAKAATEAPQQPQEAIGQSFGDPAPDRSFEEIVDTPKVDAAREAALKAIHQAIPGAGVTIPQIEKWMAKIVKNKETGQPITTIDGLSTAQMEAVTKHLTNPGKVLGDIKAEPA
jgi:hypothetical protein